VTLRSGTITYAAGSHRWGKLFRDEADPRAELEVCPDFFRAPRDDVKLLSWALEPGDCLVHHGAVVHGATGNEGSVQRAAYATRWTGDDARYAPGPPTCVPNPGLKHGDRVEAEMFPVLWRRGPA